MFTLFLIIFNYNLGSTFELLTILRVIPTLYDGYLIDNGGMVK